MVKRKGNHLDKMYDKEAFKFLEVYFVVCSHLVCQQWIHGKQITLKT